MFSHKDLYNMQHLVISPLDCQIKTDNSRCNNCHLV